MNPKIVINDSIKLIRTIRTSGTITPSSRVLIRRMLSPVDFGAARCIVELGPGNGCITRQLLQHIAPDCRLICLEVNRDFATRLRAIDDPRMQVHVECASRLQTVLRDAGIACADYVISSLPLAIIDDAKVQAIVAAVRASLCPDGRYLQYQYSLTHYKALKAAFPRVRLRFTLRNMPPAFIYECSL